MKRKIFAILSIVMVICMITAIGASANRHFVTGAGAFSIAKGSPTIDSTIMQGEGWSGPINIDKTLYGTAWQSHSDYEWSGGFYFASDDNGFYFGGIINDNFDLHISNEVQDETGNWYYADPATFHNGTVKSTADTSSYDGDGHGFDGDTFILQMDPLNYFARNGYLDNSDFFAWYNVSLMEDGAHINRTKYNTGEIPGAKVSGVTTESGWCFEAFIPWSEIANDCTAASGGEFSPSVAELAAAAKGTIISDGLVKTDTPDNTWTSVEIIYVDRYYDEDTGEYSTWQRYCTVPGANPAGGGLNGEESDGVSIKLCGIYLQLGAEKFGKYEGTGGDAINGSSATTNTGTVTEMEPGGIAADTSTNTSGGTTTGGGTANKSTSGNGSAQTFDPGIAIALVTAGAAGAGFVFTKKKFK